MLIKRYDTAVADCSKRQSVHSRDRQASYTPGTRSGRLRRLCRAKHRDSAVNLANLQLRQRSRFDRKLMRHLAAHGLRDSGISGSDRRLGDGESGDAELRFDAVVGGRDDDVAAVCAAEA